MRGRWLRQPAEEIVREYERWFGLMGAANVEMHEMYEVEFPAFYDFPLPGLSMEILTFSDTVAMLFDTQGRTDANVTSRLGNTLARLFAAGADCGFLFRGAVGFGDFYRGMQSRVLVGPAVDEAAEWYDKAEWAGIHLTPSTTRRPNPRNPRNEPSIAEAPLFVTYNVPLKQGGCVSATALDWTAFSRDRLARQVEEQFLQSPVSVDGERKRQNTLAFRAAMERRRAEDDTDAQEPFSTQG